jgi:sterol desaturase/sphingolipid hydroxylase (fatty acid hydroxylase superfamily)
LITIGIFCVVAALAFLAERLFPLREQRVFRAGFWTDVLYVPINVLLRAVLTNTLGGWILALGATHLPGWSVGVLKEQPLWVQAVGVILVLDLCFYWMHRAKHRWDWWWRLHETHHSSAEMDWFSSVRFHPLEKVLDRLLYLAPLLVLGVSEEALIVLAAVDAFIASFSHSNTRLRLGPLNYLLVGPEMHRWHHAPKGEAQRSNYGNNLSVFDWLFGTAYLPKAHTVETGLADPAYPEGNLLKQFAYAFRPFAQAEAAADASPEPQVADQTQA